VWYLKDKIKPLSPHPVPCPLVWEEQSVWNISLPHHKFKVARALREVLALEANMGYSAFDIMVKMLLYLDRREKAIVDRRNVNIYLIQSIILGKIFRVVAFEKVQLWTLLLPHLTQE